MSKFHGKFVWYELMTSDAKAAESFYRSVVGWDARDAGMPDISYTILSKGPTMVAGLMALPEAASKAGAKPHWIGYIAVDDVDAYAARVKKAGGSVHREPSDIPGVGRFAIVADPGGAGFALFKSVSEPPPGQRPEPRSPGMIGWHELHAGDREKAFAFYSGLFGWTKAEAIESPAGIYQLFAIDGQSAGGMMTKMAQSPKPFWLYYFGVEAIDAAIARVDEAGGKIANGPMQVPGGAWIANAIDPQGGMFALLAPKR